VSYPPRTDCRSRFLPARRVAKSFGGGGLLDTYGHNSPRGTGEPRSKPRRLSLRRPKIPAPCGSTTVQAEGPAGQRVALRLWCKRWDCEDCGPRKKAKFIRRALRGNPTSLLTLTVNPALYSARIDAFKAATVAIPHFIKRLRRRFPRYRVEYLLVWETTKAGWPHAHVLLRAPFIPQSLISRIWKELTGAPIVDIRAVRGQRDVARYLGKYLAKKPETPPGAKRFRTSRLYASADTPQSLPDWLAGIRFRFALESVEQFASSASQEQATYFLQDGYIHILYPA